MTPLYLANMTKRKTSDYESREYLEENFSSIISKIPFVGIGTNDTLENNRTR